MATGGRGPEVAYRERLNEKKTLVNELLALRRAKQMKRKKQRLSPIPGTRSPTTGRQYEAFRVMNEDLEYSGRAIVSQEEVRDLMKGTMLEEELNAVYGARGLEDAMESYARGRSAGKTTNGDPVRIGKSFADVAQNRLFLHKLMKERRLKLEAMKQKRFDKEQELLQKKVEIQEAKSRLRQQDSEQVSIDTDSDDENLKHLIDEVKQNIGGLEKNIRKLKREQLSQKKVKKIFKKPPAIDYEFKPWQEEQVRIATEIVDDIVKRVLDICVFSEDSLEAKLLESLLKTDSEAWERANREEIKTDAILSIYTEIQDEVLSVLVRKTAEEFAFVQKLIEVSAADLIINSSHSAVHSKPAKESKDQKPSIIDETWVAMASHRLRGRKGLWSHSRGVVSKVVKSPSTLQSQSETVSLVEENDDEVVSLSYDATPITGKVYSGEIWEHYTRAEYSFWESNEVSYNSSAFHLAYRKIIGVSCLNTSYDNCHLALGTYHGDIIVYDLRWEPFRPILCVAFSGKNRERILQIVWSLDSSRILSLSDSSCLIVWSVACPSPTSEADLRSLGISEDRDTGFTCQQLTALAILEGNLGDFAIKEGPLASSIQPSTLTAPLIAKFSTAVDVACSQNQVVVGFASGEILKYDLTLTVASRFSGLLEYRPTQPNAAFVVGEKMISKGNKTAGGIDVEVFRSHRFPILALHFIKNDGEMVSIDQRMNICVWKHSKDQLTGFNWYAPLQKFRLSGSERVMNPKGEENILFEDEITLKKQRRGRKRKGKKVIEEERREAMMEIRTLRLATRKPWYSDEHGSNDDGKKKKDSKFITKIYAPLEREILDPAADQLFHIFMKQRSTNLLVKYSTRTYSVSFHPSKALIGLQPSADGKKLFFMFLFAKHEPNVKAHITLVSLDLTELNMLQSMIIKYFMDQSEFDEVIKNKQAAFTVTRSYRIPHSEYIYCAIAGKMHVFSSFTGSEVGWCAPEKRSKKEPPEHGLQFPQKLSEIKGKVKLLALCPEGRDTHVVLQRLPEDGRSEAVSSMFTVASAVNSELQKSLTVLEQQLREQEKESLALDGADDPPVEQRVSYDKSSVRDMPKELYMQMIINSIVDNAVAVSTGERMTNAERKKMWNKDWEAMQNFFSVAS